jgi:hypothetical protein
MPSTDPTNKKPQAAAPSTAPADGLNVPKIDLGTDMERVATGSDGFWRCDEGDEIFGRILGESANDKLQTVLLELLAPAIAHKGVKGVPHEKQEYFVAKAGQVLHVSLHYDTTPVLMNAPAGAKLYIKALDEISIGNGKTKRNFEVQLQKGVRELMPTGGAQVKERPTVEQLKAAQSRPAEIPENVPAAVQS